MWVALFTIVIGVAICFAFAAMALRMRAPDHRYGALLDWRPQGRLIF